jgi:hypothetical protein
MKFCNAVTPPNTIEFSSRNSLNTIDSDAAHAAVEPCNSSSNCFVHRVTTDSDGELVGTDVGIDEGLEEG